MIFLLANNKHFDIKLLTSTVQPGDEIIHFNKHIFLKGLKDINCKQSIFFNFSFEGIEELMNSDIHVHNVYHFTIEELPTHVDKHWRFFDRYNTVEKLSRRFNTIDCGPWVDPVDKPPGKVLSIGFRVVHNLLKNGSKGNGLTLVGFSFRGCKIHPWAYELNYCLSNNIIMLNST